MKKFMTPLSIFKPSSMVIMIESYYINGTICLYIIFEIMRLFQYCDLLGHFSFLYLLCYECGNIRYEKENNSSYNQFSVNSIISYWPISLAFSLKLFYKKVENEVH